MWKPFDRCRRRCCRCCRAHFKNNALSCVLYLVHYIELYIAIGGGGGGGVRTTIRMSLSRSVLFCLKRADIYADG